MALLVLASLVWAAYALAQKQLLRHLSSQQILWLIYVCAALALAPVAHPNEIRSLDGVRVGLLAFCCANTLAAYGAFAEALEHWEVSRVSAVVATAPLFTLAGAWVAARAAPGLIVVEPLTAIGLTGACMVVVGSVFCAFGKQPVA